MRRPAVNDVFEQAPRQDPEQCCADRCADHDVVVPEPSMLFRSKVITRHRDTQAEIGSFLLEKQGTVQAELVLFAASLTFEFVLVSPMMVDVVGIVVGHSVERFV